MTCNASVEWASGGTTTCCQTARPDSPLCYHHEKYRDGLTGPVQQGNAVVKVKSGGLVIWKERSWLDH